MTTVPLTAEDTADGGRAVAATPAISLRSQTTWLARGEAFELSVDIDPRLVGDGAEVVVTVFQSVTTLDQFELVSSGNGGLRGRLRQIVIPVESGSGRLTTVISSQAPGDPADRQRLPVLAPGVYPVTVELVAGGDSVDSFVTFLVHQRDEPTAAPLAVAWMVPFGAPPAFQSDATRTLGPESVTALEEVVAQIEAAPIALTVDPTPETLEALSTSRPTLLARLDVTAPDRQVVLGPYVQLDLDVMVASGLALDIAAHRAKGAEVLRSVLGIRADPRVAVVSEGISPRAMSQLYDLGVDRMMLGATELAPLAEGVVLDGSFLVEDAVGRKIETVAIDPFLQLTFEQDDTVLAAQQWLARLAMVSLAGDQPGRGVVVGPDGDRALSPEFAQAAFAGLADGGGLVHPVTLDRLFDVIEPIESLAGPLVRDLAPDDASPIELDAAAIVELRSDLLGLASMTDVAADGDAEEVAIVRELILVSESRQLDEAAQQAYLAAAARRIEAKLTQITVPDSSFRLTDREGTITLALVKQGSDQVRVTITLASDKLRFKPAGGPAVEGSYVLRGVVLAEERTVVPIDVEARTPGNFPLTVTVTSPDGRIEVASARITVRSTGFGIGGLLSAGAAAFLLLWWARNWRSTRRDRRIAAPAEA